jgi:PAS domain S-box-containing protein
MRDLPVRDEREALMDECAYGRGGSVSLRAPVYVLDVERPSFVFSDFNEVCEAATGLRRPQVVGRRLEEVFGDEIEVAVVLAACRRCAETGHVVRFAEGLPRTHGGDRHSGDRPRGLVPQLGPTTLVPQKDAAGRVTRIVASVDAQCGLVFGEPACEERLAHLRFLKCMDRVNRAIQAASDIDQLMSDVLDVVLETFDCDRAYLLYPCDPDAPSWSVPIERTKPEYPGAHALGVDVPMSEAVAATLRDHLAAEGPLRHDPGTDKAIPRDVADRFGLRSFMGIALYPKIGRPWQFGVHQCSHARIWTEEETRIFGAFGTRLSDALTTMLVDRDLERSEERLRATLEAAQIVTWELTSHEKQLRSDGPVPELFGSELASGSVPFSDLVEIIHPDDRDELVRAVNASLTDGEDYRVEFRVPQPDGSVRWLASAGKPYQGTDGYGACVRGAAWDITAQKVACETNRRLQAELAQAEKMDSVGRLAGGMAHDFNENLSIILANTDVAIRRSTPDQPHFERLEKIEAATQRSVDLTRQLLALARRKPIFPRVIDVNDTIEGMIRMLGRLMGERALLIWLPDASAWPVEADASHLTQILANICTNARDAMADIGSVTIETKNVTLDEAFCAEHPECTEGAFVRISVSDDGCGMSDETRARAFDPFFTTKSAGEGVGMGLATVYGMIKQHGGFIRVESTLGRGTAFHIHLPRFHAATVEAAVVSSAELPPGRNETVLIVEDREPVLELAGTMLEELGYHPLAARTPGDAIRMAKDHCADIRLLITDVVMPEMNGRALAERIATIKPGVRCLFMSGHPADILAAEDGTSGDVHFIQKPFSMLDLARKVRDLVDGSDVAV